MTAVVVAAFVVALAAAARSTWSPCGLSMLSSITPIGERGRGHRFRATAAWFIAGGILGGATLGAALAGLAAVVGALHPSLPAVLAVGSVVAAAGAAVDLGIAGVHIPVLRRQVNELWLDRFRTWVYGGGFGWQIGVGFATYVMTAAVAVTCGLAALTGRPLVAFGVGLAFGTFRGLTVLLGARVTTPDRLREAFRGLEALRRPAWFAVRSVQLGTAGGLALLAAWPASAAVAAGVGVVVAAATAAGQVRVAAVTGDRPAAAARDLATM